MRTDRKFCLTGAVPNTRAHRTARQAVLVPIFGKLPFTEVGNKTQALVNMWRARLGALAHSGWNMPTDSAQFFRYRNCSPSFTWQHGKMQFCNLWFCPFCRARKAYYAYKQIEPVLCSWYGRRSRDLYYWVSSRRYGSEIPAEPPDMTNTDYIRGISNACPFKRAEERKAIRPVGMVSVAAIIPLATGWSRRSGQFVLLRENAEKLIFSRHLPGAIRTIPHAFTRRDLSHILARVFVYPKEWFSSDPAKMAALLNARQGHRVRMIEFSGIFKG